MLAYFLLHLRGEHGLRVRLGQILGPDTRSGRGGRRRGT